MLAFCFSHRSYCINIKMPKLPSRYKSDWNIKYNWLKCSEKSISSAFCMLCSKEFSIANSGLTQVKQHADTLKHKQLEATKSGSTNQLNLIRAPTSTSSPGDLTLSVRPAAASIFSSEDETLRAEILWALKCAQSNFSFCSNTDMNNVFTIMFPDSTIAKNYSMSETKIKYVLEFGVAPYVRERLIEDMKNTPFAFLFDETTTSQVKKQYDGYVQFDSRHHGRIVSHYAGSLFLGHCKSEDLKEHFFKFGENLKWNVSNLLHIGMDGPNVNKKFHKMVETELKDVHGKTILNIGTCSLHPVHTAFSKGVKGLRFDVEQFTQNLHFFFKYSSARRNDFKLCELETDLKTANMLRPVSTRWLSLKQSCVRILEQWKNLKQYFLRDIVEQSNFNREVKDTPRYTAIAQALKSDETQIYLAFVIYLGGIMESFLKPFQANSPLVHMLYNAFGQLLFDIMDNFIHRTSLNNGTDRLEANMLRLVDVNDGAIRKSLHNINPGSHARRIIADLESKSHNVDVIKNDIKLCYMNVTKYMADHLPIDSTFLRDARALHPEYKCGQPAIGRLAYVMANVMKNTTIYIKSADEFSDDIKRQYAIYQSTNFPNNSDENVYDYWKSVGAYVGSDGKECFLELATLAKHCLTISHGNAVPERGFSINKRLLSDRGQLKENTIVALRLVKESIEMHGGKLLKMGPPHDSRTWTCCMGLHVRSATVMIGVWHLLLNFSILILLAILLRHPDMIADHMDSDLDGSDQDFRAPALPTPLSKIETPYAYRDDVRLSYHNIDMGVMACLCMMGITMFMITGVLKGKPSHILPFFAVQLFDFAVTTLTATGYICYLRNIHRMVAESNSMPWRESILSLSPNALALLVLCSFIGTILLKAYVIGIVWRCYKYLTFRQQQAQMMLPYIIPDVSMGCNGVVSGADDRFGGAGGSAGLMRAQRDYNSLLPGYEEALAQSMKQQPPPSYQVAMAAPAAATGGAAGAEAASGAEPTSPGVQLINGQHGVTVILPPIVLPPAADAEPIAAVGAARPASPVGGRRAA